MRGLRSFTLIEVIVVIATLSIALPAMFAIMFVIMREQIKIQVLQQVKKEGDFVLDVMEDTIRNYAVEIEDDTQTKKCDKAGAQHSSTYGSKLVFVDKFGNRFKFYINNNQIASDSMRMDKTEIRTLSSDKVSISNISNEGTPVPFISCKRSTNYSPPVVSINFKVTYNTSQPENQIQMSYRTKIKLRSF